MDFPWHHLATFLGAAIGCIILVLREVINLRTLRSWLNEKKLPLAGEVYDLILEKMDAIVQAY